MVRLGRADAETQCLLYIVMLNSFQHPWSNRGSRALR